MGSAYGLEVDRDADWRLSAACRGYDPEWWSLTVGRRGEQYKAAHEICDMCPVTAQCLELAIRTNSHGMIFGGRDFPDRPPVRQVDRELCVRPACGQWFIKWGNQKLYCSKTCLQADSWRRRSHQVQLAPRLPQPCGTSAAYRRHRDRGEVPCQPCVEAERQRERQRRPRKRRGVA